MRGRVRDDLRIESYLQQRFGASYQPGEDEVVRYYRAHEPDFSRRRPPAAVCRRCAARCGSGWPPIEWPSCVRDWVAGLRRRADVTILPK